MKRVFIAHGWDEHPRDCWFPWLKKELTKKGFKVFIPQLLKPKDPTIENWVLQFAKVVGEIDKNTYFVGHSFGCQIIARYLESLEGKKKAGGAIFVSGFFKRLSGLGNAIDIKRTAKHWLDTPINFKKVKSHLNKSVAIFSDNDPLVPLDNSEDFKNKLGSKIIIEHKKWHFSDEFGNNKKLPVVLEELLKISK